MAISKQAFYGSGKVYVTDWTEGTALTLATAKATAVEDNQIGYLKNGFTIQIQTDTLSDQSDLGEMKVDLITKETGTCNFSLFNFSLDTIEKAYPTARATTNGVLIGGLENLKDDTKLIVFEHIDNGVGDIYVMLAGKNMSGLEAAWKQDSVTPFACTFNAQPMDDNGTLYAIFQNTTDSTSGS